MTTPTMCLLAWAQRQQPDVAPDLARALTLAQRAHRGQLRRSGDPYIEHPVAVALILAEHDAAPETVITAVLHDLPDVYPAIPVEQVRAEFGDPVAELLAGYTALDRSAEMPPAGTVDPRVLAIKVADRLHNMRTIRYLEPAKQRGKAAHTRALVAPVARAVGLTEVGDELDTLASATLRAHAADTTGRRTWGGDRSTTGVRALRGVLCAGGLLLPAHSRQRWLQDWEGELYAAEDLAERLRFVRNVLLGLPAMAVLTRRTEPR